MNSSGELRDYTERGVIPSCKVGSDCCPISACSSRLEQHEVVLYAAMPYPPPKALLKFLEPFDRSVRELALATRDLVLEEMAPCVEPMYDAYNAVALGYGSSERLKDGVCHIAVYAGHVNIGFNHGTELKNKKGLLEGTGRRVRHITIKNTRRPAKSCCERVPSLGIRIGRHEASYAWPPGCHVGRQSDLCKEASAVKKAMGNKR